MTLGQKNAKRLLPISFKTRIRPGFNIYWTKIFSLFNPDSNLIFTRFESYPDLLQFSQERQEVRRDYFGNDNIAPGHGRCDNESSRFVMIGNNFVTGPMQETHSLNFNQSLLLTNNFGSHFTKKDNKIIDFRFGGGVP